MGRDDPLPERRRPVAPPAKYKTGQPAKNRGNRRTGLSKTGNTGGQVGWRDDSLIRARMQIVWDMWMKGYNLRDTLLKVNEWATMQGQPTFSAHTISVDRTRIMQLIEDEDADKRTEHLQSLKLVKQRAWEELDAAGKVAPMAVPGLLRVIQQADETAAKIDGSLAPHRVEQHHVFSDDVQARVLVQVLVRHLGNEEAAARVLEEVQQTLELESGSVKVIDAPASKTV